MTSGASAEARPAAGGTAATSVVVPGAAGNCEPAVAGAAGGGSWSPVTVPAGAGVSGSGVVSSEAKRDDEQPLASSAVSETAIRPLLEKIIPNLRRSRGPLPLKSLSPKTAMLAKLQLYMVKIRFPGSTVSNRSAWHEYVAVGPDDVAFAQSVRLVHAAGQHDVAEFSRQRLGMVGIGAVQTDLDAGAAYVPAVTPAISWSR